MRGFLLKVRVVEWWFYGAGGVADTGKLAAAVFSLKGTSLFGG